MDKDPPTLEAKFITFQKILEKMQSVLIAFSGGVDSTLLLRVARDVLEDKVLAVTALSATTPLHEKEDAFRLAADIGVQHLFIETDELELPAFIQNSPDRCYVCKKHRFGALVKLADQKGFAWVADGSNQDDNRDYRPGLKAVVELGVRSPLSEAGLTKKEIRQLSRKLGLPTYDKPAYACLASRIPYGRAITAAKLKQVDEAEAFIRSLGVKGQVRVRHYGDTARIETDSHHIETLAGNPFRDRITAQFKKIGFHFSTLDLDGYRMGSLNKDVDPSAAS